MRGLLQIGLVLLVAPVSTVRCGGSGSAAKPNARITFSGIGSQGIFDPSLTHDPGSPPIWMSYSAVDASVRWPNQNVRVVSTRIANSQDKGVSWSDLGLINGFLDVTLSVLAPPNNAGTWINEVSTLVFDAGATASQRWKLLWHHYLQINGNPHFEHGWLGMKVAPDPPSLLAAPEIKLFAGYGYDSSNNVQGGNTQSPVGGPPAIQLDTGISSALNGCVFSEPDLHATANALYLSTVCNLTTGSPPFVALLRCSSPCNFQSASSWTYLGTLVNGQDAAAIGFDRGYSAPTIVSSGGKDYLIVTPQSSTPFPGYYNGCRAYQLTSIDNATLLRSNGVLTEVKEVNGTPGSFNGACSYDASTTVGVLYSQLFPNEADPFRLFSSGTPIP